jgi:hypothetical protein
VLREGVTEMFTRVTLDQVDYTEPLRTAVEGAFHEAGVVHPIPARGGYDVPKDHAERIAGIVGIRNLYASYFLGQTELIGRV